MSDVTRMRASTGGRAAAAAAGGLALALIAAGCAAQPPTTVVAGSTPTPRATAPRTVVTPTPQATAKASSPADRVAAEAIAKTNLPSAASIGAGFRAHAEEDDGDAQTDANGAGIDERSPQDVADGLVPLGCPGVEAGLLPLPAHAWQQTYRSTDGRAAVALVLDYPSTAKATDLMSMLGNMLAKCTTPARVRGLTTARTVATLATRSPDLVQDTRREVGPDAASQTWDESIVRSGNRVVMVVVERRPGSARAEQTTATAGIRAGLIR